MHASRFLVIFTLSALTFTYSATAQEGQHPRSDLIPGANSISFTLSKEMELDGVTDSLVVKASQLRGANQIRSIGKREGNVKEMFGEVADIAVTSNGQIYVLDSRYSKVRRYGSKNVPNLIMGGPGQGPKEFRDATGLSLIGDSVLAVLDRQRLSVMVYKITAGELQHRRTIRHGMPTVHMCSLGNRIVLQGVTPPESQDAKSEQKALVKRPLLHLYNLDGTLKRSFGETYQSEHIGMSLQLSGGPIGCFEKREMLTTAMQGTSMLYGYKTTGGWTWVTRIGDHTPVQVRREGRATHYGSEENRAEDVTRRITPLPTGEALVQVIHRSPQSRTGPKPWAHVDTYLVSPKTGRGVYVGKKFPLIMEAHGNRLYGGTSFPYPKVKIFRY